jgi:hypothetical protein
MASKPARSFVESAGAAPRVSSVDVTALYDPRDGRVMHLHHVIALEGSKRRPREEQEQSAIESARRLGCNVDGLEVLHVADFQVTGSTHRVDLRTKALIEEPAPPHADDRFPPDSPASGF